MLMLVWDENKRIIDFNIYKKIDYIEIHSLVHTDTFCIVGVWTIAKQAFYADK